jgi:apolipoprotein N-acyltransferase
VPQATSNKLLCVNLPRATSLGDNTIRKATAGELDLVLFFLGYESVWVVLVPVQLTELIFRRRADRWLTDRGLTISALVFLLGSFFAWFLWTQIARPITYHVPKYQPPLAQPILGLIMIAVLAAAAYLLRNLGTKKLRGGQLLRPG